jgi:hypothetical protein
MSYKHEFTYPDYYPDFACKCGDCRATCCHGWGIALSQDEYFRVMSTDCSPELRRRLDVAFRPATNPPPTPERYALISYNWLGRCPIQTDEGLCLLHRECGEGAIPEICRRYPRCIRTLPIHECCTSTSCEYTLELLYRDDEPVRFVSAEIEVFDEEFDTPAAADIQVCEYRKIRNTAFEILSDRVLSIDERLKVLADKFGVSLPYCVMPHDKAAELFEKLLRTSAALSDVEDEVSGYYADGSDILRFHLEDAPKMDIYLEKMLVNHLFYKAFPRSFKDSTMQDELAAIVAVRALHRYVTEAYIAVHSWSVDNFVDITAKLFRMIEHSRFDEIASRFVLK